MDLGGTKIEFVALESDGRELHRHRVATPRGDYDGTVNAIREGVVQIESKMGRSCQCWRGNSRHDLSRYKKCEERQLHVVEWQAV